MKPVDDDGARDHANGLDVVSRVEPHLQQTIEPTSCEPTGIRYEPMAELHRSTRQVARAVVLAILCVIVPFTAFACAEEASVQTEPEATTTDGSAAGSRSSLSI